MKDFPNSVKLQKLLLEAFCRQRYVVKGSYFQIAYMEAQVISVIAGIVIKSIIFSLHFAVNKRPFFKRLWEVVVGNTAEIVTNQPKDRLATKIPLIKVVETLKEAGFVLK